ncbi:MBL fold metallo-hydrolase [Pseudoalteromonas fenneropenaei]|uniref:MBL fold metallo-hydrolase n=1 Tax=Pseudoalteromonas fenneropenaei TaxID=1737459 RepID=A0ABV7CFE4_9GAMM
MRVITIPVTPFQQNCRIIVCPETASAAIVDPGGDVEVLLNLIAKEQLKVEQILLTHGHLDHVGAADQIRNALGIKIIGPHPDEQFWFDALPMQAQMFGFAPIQSFYPDQWLAEGQVVAVGNLKLQVLHCPGHTPGHVVFHEPQSGQLLVGDVLFKGSIGRTDFPKGDAPTLLASIKDKLFVLDDSTHVLSGHGENTTIGNEKRTNPFLSGRFG